MFNLGVNFKEVLGVLDYIRDYYKMYFVVDILLYLVKNGRLFKLSGILGFILKIKLVFILFKEGKVEILEKIRIFKKVLECIVELYLEDIKDKDVIIFILYVYYDEGVKLIFDMVY